MVEAGPLGPEWDLAWVTLSIVPGTAINVAAPTRKKKKIARLTILKKGSVTLCFLILMHTHIGMRPCRDGPKDRQRGISNLNNQYFTAILLRFC